MADNTDTTRPGEAEAVEAVRARSGKTNLVYTAEELVALVYPVIAAAVREQAAHDIEATDTPPRWWDWGSDHPCFGTGLEVAAYIVRGGR